jgi:aspartyl-tRNA(Asn)/glutamyl-tRNA(Gln) amidotransferase subunit A
MTTNKELRFLDISQLSILIRDKLISPSELARAYLEHAENCNPELKAFITITSDQLLVSSSKAEHEINNGEYKGPLHGIPFALKDLFWTAGIITTSGSIINARFVPSEDATVVKNLNNSGACLIGKTNMCEFAFDPTGQNPHYGWPKNPWKNGHMPGGSSSGSATAVAAGLAPLALGTDTGGSVRIPSALCGLTGMKPTYGLLSRYGVTPLSASLDHVGPMARTARDIAISMDAMVGFDARDLASIQFNGPSYQKSISPITGQLRIGVPRNYIWDVIDPEVQASFWSAMIDLERLGIRVEEVSIPELDLIEAVIATIITSEAAEAHGVTAQNHGPSLDQKVRRRIESGLFIPRSMYLQAQRVRDLIGQAFNKILDNYHLIATPTVPMPAPSVGQDQISIAGANGMTRERLTRFTRIFNANGLPAITLPCGFSSNDLPIGLQIAGRAFSDALVLRVAHAYQSVTDWHHQYPSVDC